MRNPSRQLARLRDRHLARALSANALRGLVPTAPGSPSPLDYIHEQSMEANVGSQFRMETGGQQTCVPDSHDGTCARALGDLRQDFNTRSNALHPGGAYKYRRERLVTEGRNTEIGLEGVDLSSEGVAANHNIHTTHSLLIWARVEDGVREHDHACACSEHRHSGGSREA